MNNTVYFFLFYFQFGTAGQFMRLEIKKNIDGTPVLLDMMLLESIKMGNLAYSFNVFTVLRILNLLYDIQWWNLVRLSRTLYIKNAMYKDTKKDL